MYNILKKQAFYRWFSKFGGRADLGTEHTSPQPKSVMAGIQITLEAYKSCIR